MKQVSILAGDLSRMSPSILRSKTDEVSSHKSII